MTSHNVDEILPTKLPTHLFADKKSHFLRIGFNIENCIFLQKRKEGPTVTYKEGYNYLVDHESKCIFIVGPSYRIEGIFDNLKISCNRSRTFEQAQLLIHESQYTAMLYYNIYMTLTLLLIMETGNIQSVALVALI